MYAVLDIETTGGKFNEEGITDIAIFRYDGHRIVDQFQSLVNPEREIQPYVARLTGITPKMVKTAPKFPQLAKRIIEITDGAILVAHNARFDYRMLRTEFKRLGYDYERKSLCTVDLAEALLPEAEEYKLGKLVKSMGIAVAKRHRAEGDALATLELFKVLLQKDTAKQIIKNKMRDASLGELSKRQVDLVLEVPDDTGVYYLHNKYGEIIYIGYGKQLKKEVNRHFTNNSKVGLRIQKATRSVSYELTGSLLVAMLKAMEEETRNKPEFNKKLNGKSELKGETSGNGFLGKDILILDKGRSENERSAILIQDGKLSGIGFTTLNHQTNNIPILESLLTPVEGNDESIALISAYLDKRSVLKVIDLNENQ